MPSSRQTAILKNGQYETGLAGDPIPGKRPVYNAARTLTAEDNGALCLWDSAAGAIYTLPTGAPVGTWFDFAVKVTITSNAAKVITPTGEFIVGVFTQGTDGTFTQAQQAFNGTTHVAWSGNGTTTGGLVGDRFRLTKINATMWFIEGYGTATGSEATPAATS